MAQVTGEAVAADLEGTLTTAETWRAVAAHLHRSGRRGAYRRFLLPRLPLVVLARLGLIDRQAFRDRWITDLARLLRGTPIDEMERLAEQIVASELWPARREEVVAALAAQHGQGRAIVLCSGTYQPVLEAFARRLGDEALGTPPEVEAVGTPPEVEALGTALATDAGVLTGRLVTPPNTGRRKAERLAAALAGRRLVAAYGDSLADTEMLAASDDPVAVHPEAGLRRLADERGWRVIG
jgi:HAD superfamily phosphoserine phosphatase-like hydrolase